jgi:hypothetical protein
MPHPPVISRLGNLKGCGPTVAALRDDVSGSRSLQKMTNTVNGATTGFPGAAHYQHTAIKQERKGNF